jgi:hypothetical protein
MELMPEKKDFMQSSGKNHLAMHRPWEKDVLGHLKESKEAMLEGDTSLLPGDHLDLLVHLSFLLSIITACGEK